MPAANPFVETFFVQDTGARPSSGGTLTGGGMIADHHVTAGAVLVALAILVLLWKAKFRFASTVG